MKLNLEINLDWIDEEKGLDETVKEQIINGVIAQVQKRTNDKIEEQVNKIIDSAIVKKIDEKTNELFTDFINRPVTVTDSYGSKAKVYEKVEDIVKERFDQFLSERVNDSGNRSDYGAKYTRLEYIIDKQLKDFAKEFTTNAVNKVSAEIKEHVKEGLTTKLGTQLMEVLKVNEMLKLPAK